MTSVIIYTTYNSQPCNYNLDFFTKVELKQRENIDYVIVINGFEVDKNITFPELENLTIIRRENIGYDFGGHNAALNYLSNANKHYDYYYFLNGGVIGPIIPHYLTDHWTSIFNKKITDKIKLVGTSIVCLPHSDAGGYGPKVEGFFFMTDKIGLNLLVKQKNIFCDHDSKYSAIVYGEYGLSNCILNNGYSIDCMLRQYQGVDWTNQQNWNLNNNLHPSRKNSFFGNSIIPYEVIFHKWFWPINPQYSSDNVNFNIIEDYVYQFTNKS
jgi:hypothetical protein